MEPTQILLVAVILMAGVVLQGAVGFGTGLFAVPLMVLCGVELPTAIAVLLAAVTVQTSFGTWVYREYVPWRATLEITFWRFLTLPMGIYALTFLADAGRDRAKQVIGIVLLIILLVRSSVRIEPRDHLHHAWAALAGTLSGFMGGAFGMGGPAVVLWAMAHDWPSRQSRVFFWSTFLLQMPLQLALLTFAFGWPAFTTFCIGLAFGPLVIAAAAVGAWLGDHLNRHRLRQFAFGVLVLIALAAIVSPFL